MISIERNFVEQCLIYLDSKNAPLGSTDFQNKGQYNVNFNIYNAVSHSSDVTSDWYDSSTSIWFNANKNNYLYVDGLDLNWYDQDMTIGAHFLIKDAGGSDWSSFATIQYYVDANNHLTVRYRIHYAQYFHTYVEYVVGGVTILNIQTYANHYNSYHNDTWLWMRVSRHNTNLNIQIGRIGTIDGTWNYTVPAYIPPIDYGNARLVIGSSIDDNANPVDGLYGAMNKIYIGRFS